MLVNNCSFNREQIKFSKSMPTCFSIVRKYGHLQKFSLRTADVHVFLVVASPPRVFLGG